MIEVESLTKRYGRQTAVDGYVGPNAGNLLDNDHPVQRRARRTNDGASRLNHQTGQRKLPATALLLDGIGYDLGQHLDGGGRVLVSVLDAEAAADVQLLRACARDRRRLRHEGHHDLGRSAIRVETEEL